MFDILFFDVIIMVRKNETQFHIMEHLIIGGNKNGKSCYNG